MARPSSRREWLEKFLWLADRNRPAREFRAQLGIKLSDIHKEIAKIQGYRDELQRIYDAENMPPAKEVDDDKMEKLKKLQKKARQMRKKIYESREPTTKRDSETMGTREDSSED